MPPEARELMDRLRAGVTPSEYLRGLVEADGARRALSDPYLALAYLAEAQRQLPEAWQSEDMPDLLADDLTGTDVSAIVGAEVDASGLTREDLGPAPR